jgi:hypothetical protein
MVDAECGPVDGHSAERVARTLIALAGQVRRTPRGVAVEQS